MVANLALADVEPVVVGEDGHVEQRLGDAALLVRSVREPEGQLDVLPGDGITPRADAATSLMVWRRRAVFETCSSTSWMRPNTSVEKSSSVL
jgi:hypothetical protein